MIRKLSAETKKNILKLNEEVASATKGLPQRTPEALKAKVGEKKVAEIKKLGREVFSAVIRTDAGGMPKNPVDKAVVGVIQDDAENVRNAIVKLLKEKTEPTPADYYDVYHKVMADSALLTVVDPRIVRKAFDNPSVKSGQCSACSACSACAACAACAATYVIATGAAGIAGVAGVAFL
jgi:hypothetical protein